LPLIEDKKMLFNLNKQVGINTMLLGLVLGLGPLNLPAQAQRIHLPQHPDYWHQQAESFGRVPRLVDSGATSQAPNFYSTYHFTISVPSQASDSLKAIAITQRSGLEQIAFIPDQNRAVLGNSLASGSPIALTAIGGPEPQGANEIILVFDKPVLPGQSVTVGVKVRENPHHDGIYSFGVTAFPENEHSPSLYLGAARLDFTGHN
jgi:hypothetical protein